MFHYFKKKKSDKLFNKGLKALVSNDFGKAFSCFEKAVKIDIYNGNAWVGMGSALVSICHDNSLANKYFDAALKINPENNWALLNKASYNNIGEAKESIKLYIKILEIEKRDGILESNPSIFCFIADTYLFLNEPEKAINCLIKALTYNSTYVKVLADLGKAYNFLSDYEKAIYYFDKAIDIFESKDDLSFIEKKYPITFSGKAVALFYLGNFEEALNLLNKALEVESNDLYSIYWKSKVLKCLDREKESEKFIQIIENEWDVDYIKSFEEVGLIY